MSLACLTCPECAQSPGPASAGRELSSRQRSRTTEQNSLQVLTFDLGGRRFALPASLVREITRTVAVAPLPKAPPIIEGVINFRGMLVPMLDVRRRFGLSAKALAPEQHLVIALAGRRVVALRVDRALDLTTVDARAIASADQVAPGSEYVAGIARLPDGLLIIHDLESFLSLDEARQVDGALAEVEPAQTPGAVRSG